MDVGVFSGPTNRTVCLSFLWTIVLAGVTGTVWAGGGPRDVAVVVNSNSQISREIGRYYQQVRGIPDRNICFINCPDDEVVTWQICEKQIREPIRRFLNLPGIGDRIDYIVLTKGVPLAADYVDGILAGSVDDYYSVTSVLLNIDQPIVDVTGPGGVPDGRPDNAACYAFPYGPTTWMTYGFVAPQTAWSHTLFDSNVPGDVYDINKRIRLVSRLDGYTLEQIKASIDRAANPAIDGVFVLDRNNWTFGEYGKANTRLGNTATSAYDYLTRRGFDVRFDMGQQFIHEVRGVMGYFSWSYHDDQYTFSSYLSNVFVPGSIADTYWSYSGRTFNDPGPGDRPPLIADLFACGLCGAGAYVSEPQIGTATYANILFDRYTKGYNMAESFYAACTLGMWKTTIIGDPLMAPYATPPVVAFDLDHNSLRGSEVISVTADDASGVKKVIFYLDDTVVGVCTRPPYQIVLDTTEFEIGPHTLEAIAYEDSSVETQGSARIQVSIDNAVSTVEFIGDTFQYPDEQQVRLRGKVVTAGTADIGDGFYIEESTRVCGIKVLGGPVVNRGDVVTVIGAMDTVDGQRVLNASSVTVTGSGADIPGALMMRLSSLGGASAGAHTSPVGAGLGVRSVALLVRAVGLVTSLTAGGFCLSDGSTGRPVRVICPEAVTPPVGSMVAVTGICESERRGDAFEALLRARDAADIRVY